MSLTTRFRPVLSVPLFLAGAFASLAACGSPVEQADQAANELSTGGAAGSSDSVNSNKKDAGVDAAADAHADGAADANADSAAPTCSNTNLARPTTDPGYRVQVYNMVDNTAAGTSLPSPTKSWTITYKFTVPPIPCAPTWNPENQTFYIWGDEVFDEYGSSGSYALNNVNYMFNQIVPQLMIGNTLAENGTGYGTTGKVYTSWVIQAQYFWMSSSNVPFLQAGNAIHVSPGDAITETIAYSATTGGIVASISATEGTSTITVPAPFPNESPLLFSSWKTFFEAASAKSQGLYGEPQLNVESHYVDPATLCSILPWTITDSVIPNVPATASSFTTTALGGFTCPTALDALDF
jgi:hypothetical protein